MPARGEAEGFPAVVRRCRGQDLSIRREKAAYIAGHVARTIAVCDGFFGRPGEEGVNSRVGKRHPHWPFFQNGPRSLGAVVVMAVAATPSGGAIYRCAST